MDLDKALAAHADWKVKLRVALADGQKLDAEKLASDCQCEFGQWLMGEGRGAHGADPNFKTCVEAHTTFHRCAGAVARSINAGDIAGASAQLEAGTPFSQASGAVAVAVRRLKQKLFAPV
jgi:hypothetical protein